MAFNFPSSPTTGQVFSPSGSTGPQWQFDGTKWNNITGINPTGWTASLDTAAPNGTVSVAMFQAAGGATNIDAAFVPKGAGALLASLPTGTSAGGNKRGQYAVDLQIGGRTSATQVASGIYSVIAGGEGNIASGGRSAVLGGQFNTANAFCDVIVAGSYNLMGATGDSRFIGGGATNYVNASFGVIVGGSGNTATANFATVVGGNNNNASGINSFIGAGQTNAVSGSGSVVAGGTGNTASNSNTGVLSGSANTASGQSAAVLGGENNLASGQVAAVLSGARNTASAESSVVVGGQRATDRGIPYTEVFGAIPFAAANGTAQRSVYMLQGSTTNATPLVITANGAAAGATNQVVLPNNSTFFFKATIVARRTDAANESAGYTIEGVIDRQGTAGTTAFVGTPAKAVFAEDVAAWDVNVSVDATNGALAITVTGAAASTIRWLAKVETLEVTN